MAFCLGEKNASLILSMIWSKGWGREVAVTENGVWSITGLLVLYESCFHLFALCYFSCIVTWTSLPAPEVPSVEQGGYGHARSDRVQSDPRQAVLPGAGEEPQNLELKETMPEAVSGSDHRVGFTLFCHPSSPCRASKWPVLPLCQSHGRLRQSRHLGARIFCPFKCQMTWARFGFYKPERLVHWQRERTFCHSWSQLEWQGQTPPSLLFNTVSNSFARFILSEAWMGLFIFSRCWTWESRNCLMAYRLLSPVKKLLS